MRQLEGICLQERLLYNNLEPCIVALFKCICLVLSVSHPLALIDLCVMRPVTEHFIAIVLWDCRHYLLDTQKNQSQEKFERVTAVLHLEE